MREQVLMAPGFHNLSTAYNQNLVSFANRAQSVCDDQGSSPDHQSVQGLLYERFGDGINVSSGFIQDKDSWLNKGSPG